MSEPTIEDYREGRAYGADPNRWPPAPIDSLAQLYRHLHKALRGTEQQPVGTVFDPIADIEALKAQIFEAACQRIAALNGVVER